MMVKSDKSYNLERIILFSVIGILVILISYQFYSLNQIKEETIKGFDQVNNNQEEFGKNINLRITSLAEENQKSLGEVAGNVRELQIDLGSLKSSSESKLGLLEKQISNVQSAGGDFSGVIKDVLKSVVSIEASGSLGSGAIVDGNGFVVTNYHVVENAKNYRVLTYDGKQHNAVLIGYSAPYDVALLKIESGYSALDYGDSDELNVGEKVIAVGNPLGLSFSVSEGIVSGLNRGKKDSPGTYIQTDVAINPGNSGGPLINAQGEIMGINNFKISQTSVEGLGFALNSNDAKKVSDGLIVKYNEALAAQ